MCGVDDEYSHGLANDLRAAPARLVRISDQTRSRAEADFWPENGWLWQAGARRFDLASARALPGGHNAENIAAALAVADHLGIERDVSAQAVASFTGLPHRQSLVAEAGGVAWVDRRKPPTPTLPRARFGLL